MTGQRGTIEVRPGASLWWSGDLWTVAALEGRSATIVRGDRTAVLDLAVLAGEARRVGPGRGIDGDEADLMSSVVLSALGPDERRRVTEQAQVIAELLASRDDWALRSTQAAEQLGISLRTLQRQIHAFERRGAVGLVDARLTKACAPRVDPRWDHACLEVLRSHTCSSTPTRGAVIDEVNRQLVAAFGEGVVPVPHRATAYRRLEVLSKGKHAFGFAKSRRSVAERPQGVLGRLRADRPGQYVVLDTNDLDVFAMEPVTGRWVPVQLTVAMDLFSRCVLGLRLTAISTRAADVASVLYQCVRPPEEAGEAWLFHGVPSNVLVGTEVPDGVHQERVGGRPAALPETIVVDHGKQYLSAHVIGACARLGICVQPAIPYKPTDKPTVERFFRTVRESLLQHLTGYKGPDVYSRGKDVEKGAFYYVSELEQIIREWVGSIYHHTVHAGLALAEVPGARFTPAQMFEIGLARTGGIVLPASPDLAFEFLDVEWRHIHHYGVEVRGLRYDGPGLNDYRGVRSPHGGAHRGKWPIHVDSYDVRRAWFKDPADDTWHELTWEHALGLNAPFSSDAVDYAKRLALAENRVVDPAGAVHDLLSSWQRGEVTARRDRTLARRLAAQAPPATKEASREVASLPGVVDLLEHRARRAAPPDDLDVFEAYASVDRFEVFDE